MAGTKRKENTKTATVTCGIFLYDLAQQKILVCHPTNAPWNTWSIPKGLKEPTENSFSCACRELIEETGLDIHAISILKKFTLTPIQYKKQYKVLESFLLVTNTPLKEQIFSCTSFVNSTLPEVDAWKWITLDKMPLYLHESQCRLQEEIYTLLSGHLYMLTKIR
jgi:8-oxo-dGTP pyrophosphatase MutT (NUDIX family)